MKLTIRMKESTALEFDNVDSVDANDPNFVSICTEEDDQFFLVPWANIIQICFTVDDEEIIEEV